MVFFLSTSLIYSRFPFSFFPFIFLGVFLLLYCFTCGARFSRQLFFHPCRILFLPFSCFPHVFVCFLCLALRICLCISQRTSYHFTACKGFHAFGIYLAPRTFPLSEFFSLPAPLPLAQWPFADPARCPVPSATAS